MSISEKDAIEMEEALSKVGEEKFGKGKFFIDKVQRQVPDHLHWHARPTEGNKKVLKEIQNMISKVINGCISQLKKGTKWISQ